ILFIIFSSINQRQQGVENDLLSDDHQQIDLTGGRQEENRASAIILAERPPSLKILMSLSRVAASSLAGPGLR
ncbi:TPA: hypothetical protein ACIWA4_004581, partial [Salmonella enterica subsp. enterica serovar Saintpaul]